MIASDLLTATPGTRIEIRHADATTRGVLSGAAVLVPNVVAVSLSAVLDGDRTLPVSVIHHLDPNTEVVLHDSHSERELA